MKLACIICFSATMPTIRYTNICACHVVNAFFLAFLLSLNLFHLSELPRNPENTKALMSGQWEGCIIIMVIIIIIWCLPFLGFLCAPLKGNKDNKSVCS